jgi:hypothetical protein
LKIRQRGSVALKRQSLSCFNVENLTHLILERGDWSARQIQLAVLMPFRLCQMANASQSDIGLAGLMVRCGETRFDVLIVLFKAFPPRTHPRVKLATRDSTVEVQATVLSPGVVISLPREAAALVHGPWQSSREVAVEISEDNDLIRGVISLVGLESALQLLMSNCPSR